MLRQNKNLSKGKPIEVKGEVPSVEATQEIKQEKPREPLEVAKMEIEEEPKPNIVSFEEGPDVKSRIQDEMGLSLVIEHMIRLKKPLVGHFASLDLGFLYQTFIGDLPRYLRIVLQVPHR